MDNRLKHPIAATLFALSIGRPFHGPDAIIDNVCSIDRITERALTSDMMGLGLKSGQTVFR